jgi:hypothetical protein
VRVTPEGRKETEGARQTDRQTERQRRCGGKKGKKKEILCIAKVYKVSQTFVHRSDERVQEEEEEEEVEWMEDRER